MIEMLKTYTKKVFSDLHNVIVGAIVLTALTGFGGIYYFFESLSAVLKNTMQSPTPLWAALSFVILSLIYTYVKNRQIYPLTKPNQSKRELFESYGAKWLVNHCNGIIYHFEENPFCPKHDIKMIRLKDGYQCPDEKCTFNLNYDDASFSLYSAKNIIESKIIKKQN